VKKTRARKKPAARKSLTKKRAAAPARRKKASVPARKASRAKTATAKTATAKTVKTKTAKAKPAKGKAERSFSRPLVSPAPSGSWHFPERKPGDRFYWLLKQEPTDFSFDDLWASPTRTTNWEGVRNFVARNFLRDHITPGDHAFFYHSNAEPSAVVGIVEIVRDGYPDATAFDSKSDYYDPKSTSTDPSWFQVDVRAIEKLPRAVSLAELKSDPDLDGLVLLHISQLSVQPVTRSEWDAIVRRARSSV
jgi:predicted RNA-binding protein with PUA-like domain